MRMKTTNRLMVCDLITLGVFSVLFASILFVVATVLGIVPVAFVFFAAVGAVPCGIIYMYVITKVPKPGAVAVLSASVSILYFFMGTYGLAPVFAFVGGVLADLLSSAGRYRSFVANALGYVVYMVCLWFGFMSPMVLSTREYLRRSCADGFAGEHISMMIEFITGPMFFVALGASVVGAMVGIFYGRRVLEKHFIRSGIV